MSVTDTLFADAEPVEFKRLTQDEIDNLVKLGEIDSFFDLSELWGLFLGYGLIDIATRLGLMLLFGTTIVALFQRFYQTGWDIKIFNYLDIFFKMFLIMIFFYFFYDFVGRSIIRIALAMDTVLGEASIREFRMEVRRMFFTIAGPSPEKVGLLGKFMRYIGNFINIYTSLTMPVIPMVAFSMFYIFSALIYLEFSIGAIFLMIGLFLGPLAMPFSMIFPGIGRQWASLIVGAMMLKFVISLVFVMLTNIGVMATITDSMLAGNHVLMIIMLMFAIILLGQVPLIMSGIFRCSAFGAVNSVLALMLGCTGVLAPVSLKMLLQGWVQKQINKTKDKLRRNK